jgi:hypothetical protein
MIIQFLLILTICMDSSSCKRVNFAVFESESACRKEAMKHKEAIRYRCVATMTEID